MADTPGDDFVGCVGEDGHLVGFPDSRVSITWDIREEGDEGFVTEPHVAHWKGVKITVMPGYVTDGASIPRIAWRLAGHPFGDYLAAAVIHDILYDAEVWDRETIDQCFHDLIACLPVKTWRRKLIYWAVRCCGGPTWKKHTAESIGDAKKYLEVEYEMA